MNILTDGKLFLHSLPATIGSNRLIRFEKVFQHVEAQERVHWWGHFGGDEHIEVRLSSGRPASLRLELLDSSFRTLVSTVARSSHWTARTGIAHPGIVYVRVHNLGLAEVRLVMEVSKQLPERSTGAGMSRLLPILSLFRARRTAA